MILTKLLCTHQPNFGQSSQHWKREQPNESLVSYKIGESPNHVQLEWVKKVMEKEEKTNVAVDLDER